MSYPHTLRLFFGGVANEYRVRENQVEYRAGDENWCILSDSDIDLHNRFNTEVAQWLRENHARDPRVSGTDGAGSITPRRERRQFPPFSA